MAKMQLLKYKDKVTGDKINISVSPYYSILKINEREYYFIKETGEIDGTAMPMKG
jgi:hypothetical protein